MKNKELFFELLKKLESKELRFYIGEDWHDWDKTKGEPGAIYLEDSKTKEKIYLVSAWTEQDDFYCEIEKKEWKKINDKFKKGYLKNND